MLFIVWKATVTKLIASARRIRSNQKKTIAKHMQFRLLHSHSRAVAVLSYEMSIGGQHPLRNKAMGCFYALTSFPVFLLDTSL